ncbi:BTAD domain-containing putative transcriptional regulator [Amycolatopsis sp. NPDC021455]|uniref:AfsR/SARP family transcriptional regulator n=1 Tax=Amycolatopsis sp. NPDC021455 TaxID=3154901 RepID=UPI0033C7297A
MRVRLLGSIDVLVDGVPRAVPGRRLKAVLAALALQPGQVVSTDGLIDIVWGDAKAPTTATVQSHMSHLRRILGDRGVILARSPGYLLGIDGEATDVEAATRLFDEGTREADIAGRETLLQAAVALWRGRPLADLAGLNWFDLYAHHLDELHLKTRHALADARLALGRHVQLIPELEGLIRQHPHHEQSYGQLMLAQYRAGRQADALATYQRLRRILDDDLGLAPTPSLRDLESAILLQDPALALPAPPIVAGGRGVVPAQLPAAVNGFVGRSPELSTLDSLAAGDVTAATVVAVISGTAGIGKTALAVYWAHRVRDRFPDGQLYVNLRGFDPAGPPMPAAEAVRGFLDALGVPPQGIPATPDAQIGLYRSVLAGRRVLVVLDNARNAEQVRPLLPGSPGCVAVVTSRDQLAPLMATHGAVPVYPDLLGPQEAHELLGERIGLGRTAAEPEAVAELITRCARLPLALTVTAARARASRALPLAALAEELRDADNVLDALRAGDASTDLRVVFSSSVHALAAGTARLFRLLGLHPGPEVTVAAAASLGDLPVARCRAALTELAGAQLLTEHRPGRYTLHDLLRAYARDQVHALHPDSERQAAVRRLVDHYLHSAHRAFQLAYGPPKISLPAARSGVEPQEHADRQAALRWLTAERAVLPAIAELAAGTAGCEEQAWRIAATMTGNLCYANYWPDWVAAQRRALEVARRVGDRLGQAYTHLGLGRTRYWLGHQHDAAVEIKAAAQAFAEIGDPAGQGQVAGMLGALAAERGAHRDALAHGEDALAYFRAANDPNGQAYALNNLGWIHATQGRPEPALAGCREALDLFRATGDRPGKAATLDSLGYAYQSMGRHDRAVGYYMAAIELFRDIGNHYDAAEILTRLGDSHSAAGAPEAARAAWTTALGLGTELGHPDVEHVRRRLRDLG